MPKLQVPKTSTMWQMSAAASQPASLYAFLPLNRHAETYDEPLNITKHTATKIDNPVTRCQRVKKMPRLSPPNLNRKINDERILPSVCASCWFVLLPSLQSFRGRELLARRPRSVRCRGGSAGSGRSGAGRRRCHRLEEGRGGRGR